MTAARPLAAASRCAAFAATVVAVAVLPWVSGRDPAYTVLRARAGDQLATPDALARVRAELDLAPGPWSQLVQWCTHLLHGDLGVSWVSREQVLPEVLRAAQVSLSLMGFSLLVTVLVAAAVAAPALRAALRGAPRATGGAWAATLMALPEFLLATALLVVFSVWLGWLPPYGWQGPAHAVLPALAMGLPAGGYAGGLLADALGVAALEPWVATWDSAGVPRARLGVALVHRVLPQLLPPWGIAVVGLTGAAVAVEQVFAVPGLGRQVLDAAQAQDLPLLQGGVLALVLVALAVGALAAGARQALLGPAVRAGAVPVAVGTAVPGRAARVAAALCALLLCSVLVAGLPRDPYAVGHGRLAAPSWTLPLGADASGRDVLARLAHGMAGTLGTAVLVSLGALVVGVLVGLARHGATGFVEVANATPPTVAGVLVVAVTGPGRVGAVVAVLLVGWAPLAAQTSALVAEARARPHVRALALQGVGPVVTLRHVLGDVLGPVTRHAVLRLPGSALALATLGFLGLGPQPPEPDWGLLLQESMPYLERAPWVAAAPVATLAALSVLVVTVASVRAPARRATVRRATVHRRVRHPHPVPPGP